MLRGIMICSTPRVTLWTSQQPHPTEGLKFGPTALPSVACCCPLVDYLEIIKGGHHIRLGAGRPCIYHIIPYNSIRCFHRSHNTPCLPPQNFCISIVFYFSWDLQWRTIVPRKIENNAYAKILGGKQSVLWDRENSELRILAKYTFSVIIFFQT